MKVWPKNDDIRKVLKHPQGNISFREEGPVDWPDDSFTHRRIMDGDVTAEEPKPESETTTRAVPVKKST